MGCRALPFTLLFLLSSSYAQFFQRAESELKTGQWMRRGLWWRRRLERPELQINLADSVDGCTLITPDVLRVETEETFVLDTWYQNVEFDATINIQDFPLKQKSFATAKIYVNSTSKFLGDVSIKVPAEDFLKDPKKKQFVYVTLTSNRCNLEKVILISFDSGYIFIQTDKTIYTPGTIVLYRLFIADHSLKPDTRTVDVEIKNPDGIVVEKNPYFSTDNSGIVSKSFKLPEIANVGTWQIVSRFRAAPQQIFRTEFEVKEYVLPSFEVVLETPQKVFYVDDNEFTVDITATFLHGKSVQGAGYAMFGAMINNEKKNFPDSLTNITVVNGAAKVVLTRNMITSRFYNPSLLLGSSLYVTVTILTNAGSDMVEAEKTGIPVVDTAFKILFTKSSRYFKPGLPYYLWFSVQNHDGSPAAGVTVKPLNGQPIKTNSDGENIMVINTAPDSTQLEVMVRTEAANVPERRQTTGKLVVQAYKPQGASKNYLHIGVLTSHVKLYENLQVNFYMKNTNDIIQKSIKYFTYLILNKGQIVEMGRQERQPDQNFVTMSLVINEKFLPSFRIVAYYMVTGSAQEIVSDSVLVDMSDSCIGKLELSLDSNNPVRDPEPGTLLQMKITGNPGANVGLVAVDKAVFVLNKKNRITQTKIWDEVELSDLGCTPGGGSDSAGVFTDAGLSVASSNGLTNPTRSEPRCAQSERSRRSVLLTGEKAKKVQQYQDARLRRCCEDGMQENPMGYSCQRRAQYVMDVGECAAIFLECCKFVFEPEVVIRGNKKTLSFVKMFHRGNVISSGAAESGGSDSDEYIDMKDITSRSIFSESWLWKMETLPSKGDRDGFASKVFPAALPDSITTWEFLAISMSPNAGICVSPPYELLAKKHFFVDLRLPYSVVRNEQVEVRAVLYSYIDDEIEVRVDLIYNKGMCSSATSENDFRQVVKLEAGSSLVLPFVIVPLITGEVQVEVKASVKDLLYTDGVMRKLKVVPEGMRIMKTIQSLILDPLRSETGNGVQTVTIDPVPLNDIVPNSAPLTYVSLKGDLLGETLDNSIDGANLKHLIMVPSGCGEQNMMSMTPSVIATRYLDTTGQWEKIGLHRREEAIKNIKQGYTQQLVYRKSDYSYAAFTNRPASTWLTAYVVKVFSMAFELIYIEKDNLCGSVKWLILQKQLPNGVFKEDAPVIHGEMVGGSGWTEPDASLTAFVLIALAESKKHCQDEVSNLEHSIKISADYLESRLKTLTKPYAVCITSYALSLVGRLPNHDHLMSKSTDGSHWSDFSTQLYMIEATSYALLALLQLKQYKLATPVAQWLTEQRFYGGGYGSTQATIMVFQALSEFQKHVPLMNQIDMDVTISLPKRSSSLVWRIDSSNAMLQRSEQTSMEGKITVTAKGKGQGTLTVMSVYYTPMADGAAPCKNFDFSVTLTEAPGAKKPEGAKRSMYMNICMKFLGIMDSTMTIVDVSMLTGFTPDMDDLDMLTNRVEKYISKYEMDKERSDRGSLIIYLDKVSRTETECLKFKIHQNFEVGVLQPAAVTVYEYYSLENRCTKFYHPTEEQGELRKICKGAECHCVAATCNLKNGFTGLLSVQARLDAACEAGVDYVYQTRLDKIEKNGAYDIYTMTVTTVIKLGTDEKAEGTQRQFFSHRSCRDSLTFTQDRTYIIWGHSVDIWDMKNEKSYVISGNTWIEEVPTDKECATSQATLCDDISKFIDHLVLIGCSH